MGEFKSFLLSDVAKIVRMPESTVKNWTIGRPLEITPSIMKDRGPGSRNVYSIDDVHLMALARQLCRDGLTTKTAQKVVEYMRPRIALLPPASVLLIGSNEHGLEIRLAESKDCKDPDMTDAFSHYILHFDGLLKLVQKSIEKRSKELATEKKHTRRER